MYANSKSSSRNSNWTKGSGKKKRPFCTHYNMPGHTIEKCYKLHGYPPGYKPKGRSNANANQVSSNLSNGAENPSIASNQCPISKAQCEQLLAYLTTRIGASDAHHVAIVRTSSLASVEGVPSDVLDVISSQPQTILSSCSTLMSGIHYKIPFIPTLKHLVFFLQ